MVATVSVCVCRHFIRYVQPIARPSNKNRVVSIAQLYLMHHRAYF